MTQIELTDLTDGSIINQEWQGTGVFDKLMSAVNKNIEVQFNKGRITGSDYAQVYTQSLQATLQQAVEFLLRKDLTEVQIDSELKNLELKTAQLAAERNKTEAELEKQWGYDVTRDANGELVLGANTGDGKVDKDIAAVVKQTEVMEREIVDKELTSEKQRIILDTEEQAKQYEIDYLQPAQLLQLQKQTDSVERQTQAVGEEMELKTRQLVDQELTSAKQRILLDTQEQAEQYKVDALLPKELDKLVKDIAAVESSTRLQEVKLADELTTSAKQRELLDTDNLLKQYEVDYIQPAQLSQIQKQVEVMGREISDKEATSAMQRTLLATDEQIKQYEADYLQPAQLAQVQKQVEIMGREIADKEATSAKQRILLDTQEQSEQYKVDALLPKEVEKLVKDIAAVESSIKVQETKLADELLTSDKQRAVLDKEAAIKEYENTVLQPDQHVTATKQQAQIEAQTTSVIKEIEVKDRQTLDQEATSAKQRALLDTDNLLKQYELTNMQPAQLVQVQKQVEVMGREISDKEATSLLQRSDIMKGIELKEQQLINLATEDKVTAQRIVGRAQSTINKE